MDNTILVDHYTETRQTTRRSRRAWGRLLYLFYIVVGLLITSCNNSGDGALPPMTNLAAHGGPASIQLSWQNPTGNFSYIIINWAVANSGAQQSRTLSVAESGMAGQIGRYMLMGMEDTSYTITVSAFSSANQMMARGALTAAPNNNRDSDGDGVKDIQDVDDDNDGLIEIFTIEELHNMRHNPAGTSYDDEEADSAPNGDMGSIAGAPANATPHCDSATNNVYLCGYELMRHLDFKQPDSYADNQIDNNYITGAGWLPIRTDNDFGSRTFSYFASINDADNQVTYTAFLEGGNHVLSNLYINRPTLERYTGLIGLCNNCTIQNLSLAEVNITGKQFVGSVAGSTVGGTLNNIRAHDGSVKGQNSTGGMVGQAFVRQYEPALFSNLFTNVAVLSTSGNHPDGSGGIVGQIMGISGTDIFTLTESGFSGTITAKSSSGGIVGRIHLLYGSTQSTNTIKLDKVFSNGKVVSQNSSGGGIVGHIDKGGLDSTLNIINCYSSGTVTASGAAGGLVGYIDNQIGNRYGSSLPSNSDGNVTLRRCYATAAVAGDIALEGALVGFQELGSLNNSYWSSDTIGIDQASASGRKSQNHTSQAGLLGISAETLRCPTAPNNTTCANPNIIYSRWSNDDWDFGNSTQLPLLKDSAGARLADQGR